MINSKKKALKLEEALENLRENFVESLEDEDRLIEFVASSEKIKKTSLILRLARDLSKEGYKVLLLDANFRNSSLSRISKVEFQKGFFDILVDDKPYENIITKDLYQKDLDMILAGKVLENPEEYLDINRLKNVLNAMRNSYDFVLIDTAESENFNDCDIISQAVDTVMVISSPKDEKKNKLEECLGKLEEVDAEIAGLIMTDMK